LEYLQHNPLAIVFIVVIGGFLILDLGVLNRKAHTISFKQALSWTGFWVALALAFCVGIHYYMEPKQAVTFLAAYLVELSLSVDNLFVFLLVFSSFKIPAMQQHRVLFWGIIGALAMRAICIGLGVVALQKFHWLNYVFGAILIYGGVKTFFKKEGDDDAAEGMVVRMVKKILPVTDRLDGNKFFTLENGKRAATPLFLALVVVEISDVIFAVDSIPAVLAISTDPFIVYTSNVFAILGLRSIYFALSHLMGLFRYLQYALSVILVFVGLKITASSYYKLPVEITLGVVLALLVGAVIASVVIKPKDSGPAAG